METDTQTNEKKCPFLDFIGDTLSSVANKAIEKSKPILKTKLKENFKKCFIRSTIKYLIIFLGIFFVIFNPFSFFVSHLIASILFLGVLTWTVINAVQGIIKYYKLPLFVIREKSIYNGSWLFIKEKWPKVAFGITTYNIVRDLGKRKSLSFNNMPEIKDTIKDFLNYLLKDLILFASFLAFYFILVQFIAKPLLLMNYAGIRTWEVYLFPFVQIKDFILYLVHL